MKWTKMGKKIKKIKEKLTCRQKNSTYMKDYNYE